MGILSRLKRRVAARRRQRFLTHYRDAISNIRLRLQDHATDETARYVQARMARVQSVTSWREVHDHAIAAAHLEGGLVLEFGVFSGTTARYITEKTGWTVDAFDSFEGLPEPWRDGYATGKFSCSAPPDLGPDVTLHIGWFDQTLPAFAAALSNDTRPIRYLHVDCDLYSSTKTIFEHLGDRILAGTVIVFDEYFNYAGWQEGEFKAFQECVAEHGLHYEYLTYNHEHQQVAVKITARAS
ncbi:MAG: class I SAM-dependent methyltransferase [Pseudomonadota bacterium]